MYRPYKYIKILINILTSLQVHSIDGVSFFFSRKAFLNRGIIWVNTVYFHAL